MLHVSKIVAVILFTLTPIFAGITSGLMMSNALFWTWIVFGVACLSWFVIVAVITNRMKPATMLSLSQPAAQQF